METQDRMDEPFLFNFLIAFGRRRPSLLSSRAAADFAGSQSNRYHHCNLFIINKS
jgi:hypothetical protein